MLLLHTVDRIRHFAHVSLGLLDRRIPIPLSLPPVYIALELVVLALFLLHIFTDLAHVGVLLRGHDELEAAGFPRTILFRTLLSKVPPPPIAARPSGLVEVAHYKRLSRGCSCLCLQVACQSVVSIATSPTYPPSPPYSRGPTRHCRRHVLLPRCQ